MLLKLSHLFDLVKIHDIAGLHVVQVFDALATEYGRVFAAVEVLDSLLVLLAKVGL